MSSLDESEKPPPTEDVKVRAAGEAKIIPPAPSRKNETATLQKTMLGELFTFLEQEGFECQATTKAVVELVVQLSRYQEEGAVLYPRFVICDDLDLLLREACGAEAIKIGDGPRNAATMRLALKKCAPLARESWVAYVRRTENNLFEFGVFREEGIPTAIDLRDSIISGLISARNSGGVVLVSQVADRVVELVGARTSTLTYHLTGVEPGQPSPLAAIDRLSAAMTRDVTDDKIKERAASFMRSTLSDALRRGHGTLIAIVEVEKTCTEVTQDSVSLKTSALDVADAVRVHVQDASERTLTRIFAYARLIEGMLATDGITVFRTDAVITHYNAFVNDPGAESGALPRTVVGGARRRAFRVLKKLVDAGSLVAAFFRSADGGSEFYEVGR